MVSLKLLVEEGLEWLSSYRNAVTKGVLKQKLIVRTDTNLVKVVMSPSASSNEQREKESCIRKCMKQQIYILVRGKNYS